MNCAVVLSTLLNIGSFDICATDYDDVDGLRQKRCSSSAIYIRHD